MRRFARTAILAIISQIIVLSAISPCSAQSVSLNLDGTTVNTIEGNSGALLARTDTAQPDFVAPSFADRPQPKDAYDDGEWHFDTSPYIWLPGVHGIIGALGRDSSVHATPRDLISDFRFGLMGIIEARKNRLLMPLDIMWVRLGDSKALPFSNLEATNANVKAGEFILTPKVGVRVLDQEKIKIDALAGIRYWHFTENVHFVPSSLNLNFSASQDWVDPLIGGRITGTLAPKIGVIIFGDVGGWGTASQLDYQFGGVLGYKVKPKWTLQAGYRYLFVNYRHGGTTIQMVTSGALVGITLNVK